MHLGYEKPNKKNRLNGANIFSKLFFCYTFKECKRILNDRFLLSDLYKLEKAETSEYLGDKLQKLWEEELEISKSTKKEPNIRTVFRKLIFWPCVLNGFASLLTHCVFRQIQMAFIPILYESFSKPYEDAQKQLYISMSLVFGFNFIYYVTYKQIGFHAILIGRNMRVAATSLVYRKLLKIKNSNFNDTSAGQIINFLSNDSHRFETCMPLIHYIWVSPLIVAYNTNLLAKELGYSSAAGIICMVLITIMVQTYVIPKYKTLRASLAVRSDKRIKLINEIITGIRVIKMYSWEKPFEKLVKLSRAIEVDVLRKTLISNEIICLPAFFGVRIALYFSLIAFVLTGHQLNGRNAYSSDRFLVVTEVFLSVFFALSIKAILELDATLSRLKKILLIDEKATSSLIENSELSNIVLRNVFATHGSEIILKNINVVIPRGKLCAIVGPVGSGKSCFLQVLLNEITLTSGDVSANGRISYASQEPWLFASTLKNNILFGQRFDYNAYNEVLNCCSLKHDLEQFSNRDDSMVGEKGVILSGGQKARINLARAVYQNSDIYLLDDPLSAVDAHIGNNLFDKCLLKFLKGKTRILVTHQLQYLSKADFIIVLNKGSIEICGTDYDEIRQKSTYLKELWKEQKEKDDVLHKKMLERNNIKNGKPKKSDPIPLKDVDEKKDDTVQKSMLSLFLNICSIKSNAVMVVLLFVFGQFVYSGTEYWISPWIRRQRYDWHVKVNVSNDVLVPYTTEGSIHEIDYFAIIVYTILNISFVSICVVRMFIHLKLSTKASLKLHDLVFHSLIATKVKFFESNTSGDILNRFSKDMGDFDEQRPYAFTQASYFFLSVVGSLVLASLFYWQTSIPSIVYMIYLIWLLKKFSILLTKLKKLEGDAKAPVFTMIKTTYTGICSIRSSKAEYKLIKEFDEIQDLHTSAETIIHAIKSGVSTWILLVGVVYQIVIGAILIYLHKNRLIDDSVAGLIFSSAFALTSVTEVLGTKVSDCLGSFASIGHIMEYLDLEPEENSETDKYTPIVPNNWANEGCIVYNNVYMQYEKNDTYVLNNINFYINPTEKVGIVGRTGAGKSSLIAVLFRLINFEGTINIDDVDTKTIDLHQLRSKISIIPQDPLLFCNTVRYNLDPFEEYTDNELWTAIEEVHLKEAISSLDFMVMEEGNNFSVGQKQLICLARAILKKNKILVLDEATANVDLRTDNLIQSTIRRVFKNCTVLTIAHRLTTIMDSDKVMVISDGQVIEFDHPFALLQIENGSFTQLVAETGPIMQQSLTNLAKSHYGFEK